MASFLTRWKARYRGKGGIVPFDHPGERPVLARAATPMEDIFWSNTGPVVHKWHHYLPIYDRYFGPWRDRPLRMLEIGVSKGGSLSMWRKYFGPEAVIFGIDIDPTCARFDGISAQVRIGSQADAGFLRSVVEEMGGVDIVLDDGSHWSEHMKASLDVLYPLLSDGGVYMIEDTHACYWRDYGGGHGHPASFLETVKDMVDDLHHWYHPLGQTVTATAGHLSGLHLHDSIVVLEKAQVSAPRHSHRGQE
ncbi:MAG: class I SAM-dependent methyltransferase [Paracoccaceae bacterium]